MKRKTMTFTATIGTSPAMYEVTKTVSLLTGRLAIIPMDFCVYMKENMHMAAPAPAKIAIFVPVTACQRTW